MRVNQIPIKKGSYLCHNGTLFTHRCLVVMMGYCTLGITYNYRIREARGCDVIPNVAFWKDLPSLVKVNT